MEIGQALRVHRQLSHRLLPFWNANPGIQDTVDARLRQWARLDLDDDAFFKLIVDDLRVAGNHDDDLLEAVRFAGDEPVDQHLETMFESAKLRVRQLYNDYGVWTGGNDIRLQTLGMNDPPYPERNLYGKFGVSGSTKPGTVARGARVEIYFAPALLGPPTWASVPYVLFHELVCHASQGPPSSDPTDPFTDGWMDLLAEEYHDRFVESVFPWDPAIARQEGKQLCTTIRQLGHDLPCIEQLARSARIQGITAATRVRSVLADLIGLRSGSTVATLFDQLSIELNTLAPSTADETAIHRTFVANLLDRGLETRRNGVLRKWVLGTSSASDVLSFK